MLALSPPLFSTIGWPLEDHPTSHDHNNYFSAESSFLQFPAPLQPHFDQLDHSTPPSTAFSGESTISSMAKKLNHNASERDRRKKINNLYSSLRSLVPADQAKRLSIPATVSRVLKYIPELQQQVEGLIRRRDELLSRMSKQENVMKEEKQVKSTARINRSSSSAVSTSRLSDCEVSVQISTLKSTRNSISQILQSLEEDGLEILNASSFESYGGRVFYNLHLQVDMLYRLECENLSEKLMSFYA